jgi:hypothetical protein
MSHSLLLLSISICAFGYAAEPLELQFQARQIIAHKCWKCHGSERDEGDLRLHTRQHILDAGVVDLNAPDKSEIIKRITLPEGHDDIMPLEAKPLSQEEIQTLTKWIETGMQWEGRGAYREAPLELSKVPSVPNSPFSNPIDQHIAVYFKQNNLVWAEPISDAQFIRRAYFDAIGLLPTEDETKGFLENKSPGKRENLVKELLARNTDYELHWLTFWNDLLRNDYSGTGFITGGRKQITAWLREALKNNKPYHTMVKEIFSNDKNSYGFIKGIEWRGTVSASQTLEMQAAQNSAQVFLGINLECASCHDSFTSNWSLNQSHQFASIFSSAGSVDMHRCEKPLNTSAKPGFLFKELGSISEAAPLDQRLKELGDLMTSKQNGRLARTIVNRYWAQLMGRGFIFQVDEMDSLPWSQTVLDDLSYRFVENNYDLKWLTTEIMTSKAYQLPSSGADSRYTLANDEFVFKGPIVKRLTAEQFCDAFSFSIYPIYQSKDKTTARASEKDRDGFQTALGRPNRENVTSARAERGNLLESLELTNGTVLDNALKQAAKLAQKDFGSKPSEFIHSLFKKGLQRPPSERELAILTLIHKENPSEVGYHDILWIFINLPEFQSVL